MLEAAGEPATYLRADRAYRSEEDVFEHYSQEERDQLFGSPPATVAGTLETMASYPELEALLCAGGVFTPVIISSYQQAMLAKWRLELSQRIIPTNAEAVRRYRRLHGEDADTIDERAWSDIHALRLELMKDTNLERSLFSRIRDAISRGDDGETSRLQVEMNAKMAELDERYRLYARNLLDIAPEEVGAVWSRTGAWSPWAPAHPRNGEAGEWRATPPLFLCAHSTRTTAAAAALVTGEVLATAFAVERGGTVVVAHILGAVPSGRERLMRALHRHGIGIVMLVTTEKLVKETDFSPSVVPSRRGKPRIAGSASTKPYRARRGRTSLIRAISAEASLVHGAVPRVPLYRRRVRSDANNHGRAAERRSWLDRLLP